jgi:hypothetical protein
MYVEFIHLHTKIYLHIYIYICMYMYTGVPSIPISTLITVLMATIIPKHLKSIIVSGELLGKLLLLLFFASIGTYLYMYIDICIYIYTCMYICVHDNTEANEINNRVWRIIRQIIITIILR